MLFGAYVPNIDYRNFPGFVPVVERVKEWVSAYPVNLKICSGKGNARKLLELPSHFLTQFVVIRRAFHIHKEPLAQLVHKVIDLEDTLARLSSGDEQ